MTWARPSIPEDVQFIADRIRPEDLQELDLHDIKPVDALTMGFVDSLQPLTVIVNGSPVAMFGIVPVGDKNPSLANPSVWLLGTQDLFTIKVPFLRQSRAWLNHIQKPFPCCGNWVDSRNTMHCRWLRWLGFEIQSSVLIKDVPVHYYFRTTT